MAQLTKIFQQTSWQILGKVVTSFSTFIILGIVARNYGKEGTGIFTLALTYLGIFYLLADFGFNAHVLKGLKSGNLKLGFEWRKLFGARLVWSVLLVVVAVGMLPLWPFTTPLFSQAVIFGSLAIVGSAVFTTCNLIFQDKLRYDLSVLSSSFGTIISLIIFIALVSFQFPFALLTLAHMLGWIVIAVIAFILIKKILHQVIPIIDKRYTINLVKDSWPIAATLALNVVYFRADSFLIAYFKSVSDAGIYNVAYSVFQSALVLPAFIMNSYYPLMLKSQSAVKSVGLGLLGLSAIGTLITLLFSPVIIKILTGGGFSGSETSLQILSLGFPAYFLSSLLMWFLITKNQYKSMLLLYTSGLIFNLVLNFIFIPKYSYIAAAWITVISEYLILSLQVFILAGNRLGKGK